MGGGQALSQRPPHCADEPQLRGREPGDKRTQLGFCRSSRRRRLGAAGSLDFNLDGTTSVCFFLHAHDGSPGLDIWVPDASDVVNRYLSFFSRFPLISISSFSPMNSPAPFPLSLSPSMVSVYS